jgi:hypothetical protein
VGPGLTETLSNRGVDKNAKNCRLKKSVRGLILDSVAVSLTGPRVKGNHVGVERAAAAHLLEFFRT